MPSLELSRFLQLRADGVGLNDAAFESGIGLREAELWEQAIASGEIELPKSSTKEEPIMARRAKPEHEEQIVEEILKPDFERAIRVIRHDIAPAEEKNASARGDLSASWKVVEDDCHVNKGAAKQVAKLIKASDEKRDDWLRSFRGLLQAAGIGITRDLVDEMENGEDEPIVPTVERAAEGLATLQPELTH